MLSFRFQYAIKPSREYKIEYGLKSKPRPYHFNFPVGLKSGNYRFNYDRRDQIHIDKRDIGYMSWGKDMHIEENANPFMKKLHEIEMKKGVELERPLKREVSSETQGTELERIKRELSNEFPNIELETIKKELLSEIYNMSFELKTKEVLKELCDKDLKKVDKQFYQDIFSEMMEGKIKNLDIDNPIELGEIEFKILDIYQDFLLKRGKIKGLIKEIPDNLLKPYIKKGMVVEDGLKGLDKPSNEVLALEDNLMLEVVKKALQQEAGRLLGRVDIELDKQGSSLDLEDVPPELSYEKVDNTLASLIRGLEKNKDIGLTGDFIKDLSIDASINLSKEEKSEIAIKSIVLLSKLSKEINISEEHALVFKVINEIYRHKELMNQVLFLYTMYDIEKDIDSAEVESHNKKIEKCKDRQVDKGVRAGLNIEEAFKKLINNTKHDLYTEIKERLLIHASMNEVEIEAGLRQIEKVYEVMANIEKRMKQLDKTYIEDLYTEDEFLELEESPIGKILLEYSRSLDKISEEYEIVIDESVPMVKAYKEIMVNNDIQASKQAIEIDVNKEKEFKKVFSEIAIEKNETKIKFNKRFWFLRATDPFDWKILPYSDYPYKNEPIVFNQDKKIPDNWQLDMIPKLHQDISEHPMPFGQNLGNTEMALSIEIMIDVINIMILIWSRMYYNFSGYTGSQAVIRFAKLLYDWLMLETSIEEMEKKGSKEHYFRAYRWIRWEAEKVAIKARDDMTLSGNVYIDEWIFELIYYMENHHFDTMPIFDVVGKMDEFRALLPSDDPQGDITFTLDKVKGMRHKIIECKANKSNE